MRDLIRPRMLESRQTVEDAIETGREGVYLRLMPEQSAKLRRL